MDLEQGNHLPELQEELVCIIFDRVEDLEFVDHLTNIWEYFCKDLDEMDSNWEKNWGWLLESMCQIINDIHFRLSDQDFIDYMKDVCNNVAFIKDVRTNTSNKLLFLLKKMNSLAMKSPVHARWDDFSSSGKVNKFVKNC